MYPFTTWTDGAEAHSYDWRGLRIPYYTLGEGPPLVLVHGLGLNFHEWERNIETLLRFGKIYALDLPGFGHADKPERILSCRELAEAALDWAQDIGMGPGIWLGHSLGGEIALWAGALNPAQLSGIVLAGSTGLPPRPGLPGRLLGLVRDGYREAPNYILRVVVSYVQAGPLRVLKTLQASDPAGLLPLTGRLQMPVLVMHGRRDPIVPLHESRMTARRLPYGELCLIEAPHAMNFSAAEAFNAKLAEFLARILQTRSQPEIELTISYLNHKLALKNYTKACADQLSSRVAGLGTRVQ